MNIAMKNIIEEAKKHALTKLDEAKEEGGDYWNAITVCGIEYDYNLYDYETEGQVWGLSVYPLEKCDYSGNWFTNTREPIIEGLPVFPSTLESFNCMCCGEKLITEELVNAETQAGGHCFHCQKGNCDLCGSEVDSEQN